MTHSCSSCECGTELSTAVGALNAANGDGRYVYECTDGKGAMLALLINSRLEARWLPHSRQVKTLPCRVHRKVVRHAADRQNQDVQMRRRA